MTSSAASGHVQQMLTTVHRVHISPFALALVALGCVASDGRDDGGETTASSSSVGTTIGGSTTTSDEESSSALSDDTTDGAASSESGDDPPLTCGDPIDDGLVLSDVTLFQTIGVPIAQDCAAIDPAARVAPIVAGHVAMARATVILGAAWVSTDLVARVEVSSAAGDESFTGTCTLVDPGEGTADLQVELPPASVQADTRWSVSVATCEGVVLGSIPDSGLAQLDAETTGVLRLHLVPFEVGGFVPDTSQPVLDGFRDALLAHYPVTDVEITVDPVEPDDNGGQVDMGALLVRIVQLQEADLFASGDFDATKADVYYYGLVSGAATREEFCDECPTGTSEAGGGERAGSAVGAAFADVLSESTLVHEMGHLHGLLHSPCGEPSLQDADFPYADGATHTEGWDFRTGELVPPTHNDLMGYCQPRWVSDYNFRKLVDWVQLAARWRGGMRAPAPASVRALTRTRCTEP